MAVSGSEGEGGIRKRGPLTHVCTPSVVSKERRGKRQKGTRPWIGKTKGVLVLGKSKKGETIEQNPRCTEKKNEPG